MTSYRHKLIFGARADQSTAGRTNKEWLERWGIACHDESLTGPQALRIANGTDPYDPNHPEAKNFLTTFRNGGGRYWYIGCGSFTDQRWARIADRIVNAALTNMRYARFVTLDGAEFVLSADQNVGMETFVGTNIAPREVIDILGLVHAQIP